MSDMENLGSYQPKTKSHSLSSSPSSFLWLRPQFGACCDTKEGKLLPQDHLLPTNAHRGVVWGVTGEREWQRMKRAKIVWPTTSFIFYYIGKLFTYYVLLFVCCSFSLFVITFSFQFISNINVITSYWLHVYLHVFLLCYYLCISSILVTSSLSDWKPCRLYRLVWIIHCKDHRTGTLSGCGGNSHHLRTLLWWQANGIVPTSSMACVYLINNMDRLVTSCIHWHDWERSLKQTTKTPQYRWLKSCTT